MYKKSKHLIKINAVVKQLVKNDSTYHLHEQGASNHALGSIHLKSREFMFFLKLLIFSFCLEASSIELNKLSTKLPTPTISIRFILI